MGGSAQWQAQAPLADTRQLIAVDLPGFGASASEDRIDSIAGFADWLLQDLTRQGITRFDLMGHSMGGMIVQEMVRRAPGRVGRLILYATSAKGVLPDRFESIETSMHRATTDGADATARRISATWFRAGEAAAEYPHCAEIAARTDLPAMLAGLKAMQGWSAVSDLAAIEHPALVIWGDGDRTYGWPQIEELWRTIPNSSLAVIPHCAHAVHGENPAVFNTIVDEFLARTDV